jgi:hypothetical protein
VREKHISTKKMRIKFNRKKTMKEKIEKINKNYLEPNK